MDYKLKIVQLSGVFFEGNISYCHVKTIDGCMGILPGHVPIITCLEISGIKFKSDVKEYICAVFGGFMYVEPTGITILTEDIQHQEDIDEKATLQRKRILENSLKEKLSAQEQAKIQSSLKQAINLLNIKEKGF